MFEPGPQQRVDQVCGGCALSGEGKGYLVLGSAVQQTRDELVVCLPVREGVAGRQQHHVPPSWFIGALDELCDVVVGDDRLGDQVFLNVWWTNWRLPGATSRKTPLRSSRSFTFAPTWSTLPASGPARSRLRARNPQAAPLRCLLSVAPGPDVPTDTAATIPDEESAVAMRGLATYAARGTSPDRRASRWRFHDLIRLDTRRHAIPDLGLTEAALAAATDWLLNYCRTTC